MGKNCESVKTQDKLCSQEGETRSAGSQMEPEWLNMATMEPVVLLSIWFVHFFEMLT